MKQEIIKALKENTSSFGLMDNEMQDKAKEIGPAYFYQFKDKKWWATVEFIDDFTYKLTPCYTETEKPKAPDMNRTLLITEEHKRIGVNCRCMENTYLTVTMHIESVQYGGDVHSYPMDYKKIKHCPVCGKGINAIPPKENKQ